MFVHLEVVIISDQEIEPATYIPETRNFGTKIPLDTAVKYLAEVSALLESLEQTELLVPSRSPLQVVDTVVLLGKILRNIQFIQEGQKKQRTLMDFFKSSGTENQSI